MAKITRVSQLLFGSSGPGGDFGVFGSLNTTPTYSKDPVTIQSLAAFLTGWAAAVKTGEVPALEDMNSLFYLLFYQVCYLLQQGVAEWDSGTTYYTNSIVSYSGALYYSIQDTNLNKNPSSETAWWGLIAQDSLYVKLAGDQTVAGIKTFSSFPVTPSGAPSSNYQVANKKYVDDTAGFVIGDHIGILAGTVVNGGTIPLPSGFSQAQCKWMVGLGTFAYNDDQHSTSFALFVTADANRIVASNYKGVDAGPANYIIIGIK